MNSRLLLLSGCLFLNATCTPVPDESNSSQKELSPYATDENANIAAKECRVYRWRWVKVTAFDAPQPEHLYFHYELVSLPSEEIAADEGRAWDRSKRVDATNSCLFASFDKQGVTVFLSSPALVEKIN